MELTFKQNWNKVTFQQVLKEIQNERPDKTFRFHIYGTFQEWKAKDTNFLEVASTMLDPSCGDTKVEDYYKSLLSVRDDWHRFCAENHLSKFANLSDRWIEKEILKIEHWLLKSEWISLKQRGIEVAPRVTNW